MAWNKPFDPLPSGYDTWFKVWMEYPAGNWTMIDSTEQTSYSYQFYECTSVDPINFRIELEDIQWRCFSVSSVDGEVLYDDVQPEAPVMDSVSVLPNGDVIIGWQPSPSGDTKGYVIFIATA